MANSYKALKEEFVSNLSGGSITEINLVTAVAPAAYLLWSALQAQHSFFQPRNAVNTFVDFFLNVGGLVLAVTVYALMPSLLLSLLLAPATLILALPPSKVPPTRPSAPKKVEGGMKDMAPFPRRPFLTVYRGGMMVITCLAILAVDFRIFPRKFAKVETWGTSLMDVGVGSFVFSAGLVASKSHVQQQLKAEVQPPRDHNPEHFEQRPRSDAAAPSFLKRISLALRQSIPLLLLGVVRLVSVKNLEYAEHVSEYGVHWNFFFTLALLPLSLTLLSPILAHPALSPYPVHGTVGLLLGIADELVLGLTPLKAWALTAPRTDLISSNKEGLVSSIGYLAIFLLGMETGSLVLPRFVRPSGVLFHVLKPLGLHPERASHRNILLSSLALCTAFYAAFLALFLYAPALKLPASFSVPVSRRLANLPYVLWIASFNTGQLLLFALVESFVFPAVYRANTPAAEQAAAETATPGVLDDFNSGGLLLFVVANLATGMVNIGIDTLSRSNAQALGILIGYMTVLAVAARFLKGVKLKI